MKNKTNNKRQTLSTHKCITHNQIYIYISQKEKRRNKHNTQPQRRNHETIDIITQYTTIQKQLQTNPTTHIAQTRHMKQGNNWNFAKDVNSTTEKNQTIHTTWNNTKNQTT